jgi:hypothetical protein
VNTTNVVQLFELPKLGDICQTLSDLGFDYEVRHLNLHPYINVRTVWKSSFELKKSILSEHGIAFRTSEDTAGFIIRIDVAG